jgi:hypothetical protein
MRKCEVIFERTLRFKKEKNYTKEIFMKPCNAFFIPLVALFCFSCAGGKSAKIMPEHITAGTKEMA